MKGYLCPECHGLTGKRCKVCKGCGWIAERDFQAKYDDDFQRIPVFGERFKYAIWKVVLLRKEIKL